MHGEESFSEILCFFWVNFIETGKSMGENLQNSSFYMKGSIVNRDIYGSFMNKD